MLPIWQPCMYEELGLQYYLNNCYSDVSCMSMSSSELSDLEKMLFLETPTGPFPLIQ